MAVASQDVQFTGERVVPGQVNQDLWNEHYSRYRFAATFAGGKRVLDVGCGTGYGTALLAESAAEATGFDVSAEAVEYAKEHYGHKATFIAGDALHIPAENHSFQLVTAFEVIEHVAEYEALIAEAARVLVEDGIFLASTPNKLYYAETRKEVGPNPYHVHEFELEEFGAVLRRSFPHVEVIAQNQQEAVVFGGQSDGHGTSYVASEPSLRNAQFFIALCGNRPITTEPFAYVAEAGNLLRDREHYIQLLQEDLGRAQADHLRLLEEHERSGRELERSNAWAQSLDRELSEARQKLTALQRDAEEKTKWAQDRDRQLKEKSSELAAVVGRLDEAERELAKRTEWAREQEALCAERTRWAQTRDEALRRQAEQVRELQDTISERTQWAQAQDKAVETQAEQVRELQDTVKERTGWAVGLDRELAMARGLIEERTAWAKGLDLELAVARRLVEERTLWAQGLDQELAATRRLIEERTAWALQLDAELAATRALVDERTRWALRLDAELTDHSSVGRMLRSELHALTERTADLEGSEANLEQLSNQLEEENLQLKEQIRRSAQAFEESQERLAEIGDIADRLSHERELVRTSKWLKLGQLLHLGPRLAEENPPV